jgi:hypothetical protein
MDPEQIGLVVGLIVAASLALQTALGPTMASIVEAIKATGRTPEGFDGIVSLAIGTGFGAVAGLFACAESGQLPLQNVHWIGIGAFAGLIGLGAGGVRSHLVAQGYQQQMAWNDSKAAMKAEQEQVTNEDAAQSGANLTVVETTKKAAA